MNNVQLSDFFTNIAHKPYCSNELLYGLQIRPKKTAITMPYIQANQPCMVHYFFFDIDRPEAVMAWHDENLPMPYWTAQNPENGHAHICYKLKVPICTSEYGSQKAIKFGAAVQAGIAKKLGSDVNYTHLITKNPFHSDWRVEFWSEEAYTLEYLADFVDLPKKLTKKQEQLGLGRNCTLFDTVRKWAYKAIRGYRNGFYVDWYAEVLKHAHNANKAFPKPLPYSELKATAKSIARFCWKNDAYCYQEFIQRQSYKGRLGGKKSKRKPISSSEATLKPWVDLDISQSTYYRRKKLGLI